MRLLIGISGQARSGKDTVADYIEELLPGIHRTNFSHAIREEYDALNGTRTRHDEEEKDTHRPGISRLAEQRRSEDPQYWVHKALTHEGDLLVAGVRAVSEAEAFKERDGILIRVEVSEKKLRERLGDMYEHHQREINEHHLDDYDGWDYVIHNDGTLADLKEAVVRVVKFIEERD